MLSDPQSVTISGSAISLPRTGSTLNDGLFQSSDGLVKFTVNQAPGKRNRRRARLDHRKVGADPFNGALNANYSMAISLLVDDPIVGYTITEKKAVVDGFIASLTSAKLLQILGGEV